MKSLIFVLFVVTLLVVMTHDLALEPRDSYSARATIAAIDGYRAHISPHLKGVIRCRFTPTCSAYGREVIRKYGFARGAWLALVRVSKCGPWTKAGTVDEP
ncbi:MAG: hypothetical protein NVSMB68_16390 [Thermoanaerobaculia bacterium]